MTSSHGTTQVRRIRPADHEQIRDLAPELLTGMPGWRSAAGQRTAVAHWVDSALAAADNERHAVFVAIATEDGGEETDAVLGFVTVAEHSHFTGEREGYVGELVVAPWCRKRGIGRALMTSAEDWVRRRGLTRISLETGFGNIGARAAYASLGYLEEQVTLTKTLA